MGCLALSDGRPLKLSNVIFLIFSQCGSLSWDHSLGSHEQEEGRSARAELDTEALYDVEQNLANIWLNIGYSQSKLSSEC